MRLSVEEFVENLLSKEAEEQPCDNVKPGELELEVPKDFDESKFNKGRHFFLKHKFSFIISMLMGLVTLFTVSPLVKILISTRRSSSVYTAYRRYFSTILHIISWFENELKPGSESWKSLYTARKRHLQVAMAGKLKRSGILSQKDIALGQYGFIIYSMLKPERFGIRQLREGDWDAYTYFWRTIGTMVGLEDKYNIPATHYETLAVCRVIQDRLFTPSLENVSEYFEHLSRMMLEGLWFVNPLLEADGFLYMCRTFADVPGYIYTENDRIKLQAKLLKCLEGRSIHTGVDSRALMSSKVLQELPERSPRLLYYKDYETIENAPAYKELNFKAKYKIYLLNLCMTLNKSRTGRMIINLYFKLNLLLCRYFPITAFFRFGIKNSFVNMFVEGPTDNMKPKTNAEYYKPKEKKF